MDRKNTNKLGMILLMVNAFVYISLSLYAPFLSAYYSRAGMNAVQIGILLTIAPVVAILIQPLWAIISDRTGRRKDVLSLVILGSSLSMFSYYIGQSFLTFFIASILLSVFCTSIIPLSDAITLKHAHKNQIDFAKIRMGGTIGFAIAVILAGILVKQNPKLQFILGFIGYLILLFFVRKIPEDEKEATNEDLKKENKRGYQKSKGFRLTGLLHIFNSKQIYFMLAFAFICQVGLSFYHSFLGVYMVDLGLSEGQIGVISSISAISEIPVLFLINRVIRKVSPMKLTILSCLILGVRIFIITGGSILFIIIAQALQGLTYMIMYFSCAVYISNNVKQENQSKGQSILTIIQAGIGSIVGNIFGGLFVDHFGLNSAYRYMALVIITISVVLLMIQLLYRNRVRKNSSQHC